MRLDKLLGQSGYGSRNQVKKLIRSRQVYVDGIDWRIDPANVILSEKDSRHPRLDEAPELFDYDKDYYTR